MYAGLRLFSCYGALAGGDAVVPAPEIFAPPDTAVPEFCSEFAAAAGPVTLMPEVAFTASILAASLSELVCGCRSIGRILAIVFLLSESRTRSYPIGSTHLLREAAALRATPTRIAHCANRKSKPLDRTAVALACVQPALGRLSARLGYRLTVRSSLKPLPKSPLD